jgi:hypothetical protein
MVYGNAIDQLTAMWWNALWMVTQINPLSTLTAINSKQSSFSIFYRIVSEVLVCKRRSEINPLDGTGLRQGK